MEEIESFWDMMPERIGWEKWVSDDEWGTSPIYGPPLTIPHCRVQDEVHHLFAPEGQELLITSTIYIGSFVTDNGEPVNIDIRDRITLPTGAQPRIYNVNVENDETGPHHIVVIAGSAGGSS